MKFEFYGTAAPFPVFFDQALSDALQGARAAMSTLCWTRLPCGGSVVRADCRAFSDREKRLYFRSVCDHVILHGAFGLKVYEVRDEPECLCFCLTLSREKTLSEIDNVLAVHSVLAS